MEIIVTDQIRKREFGAAIPDEAIKLFDKLKGRPELARVIAAPGLPERTTLHKVYATTADGARRLLFFCRHAPHAGHEPQRSAPDRWVLLFYRTKSDPVGANMSAANPAFSEQLPKRLRAAWEDIAQSTPKNMRFERL
jgi:hypothetical protein